MLVLLLLVAQVVARQVPLDTWHGTLRSALSPEVKAFAHEVVTNGSIPGLSLGVVHLDGHTEFETFGIKTEDGDKMTTNVSVVLELPRLSWTHPYNVPDTVQHCILLESISRKLSRYSHGRFFHWSQCYPVTGQCTIVRLAHKSEGNVTG